MEAAEDRRSDSGRGGKPAVSAWERWTAAPTVHEGFFFPLPGAEGLLAGQGALQVQTVHLGFLQALQLLQLKFVQMPPELLALLLLLQLPAEEGREEEEEGGGSGAKKEASYSKPTSPSPGPSTPYRPQPTCP